MEFALPAALALALLALPVAWLARRRAGGYSIPSVSSVVGIRPGWRLRAARALPALRVLAVVALAIAVAGPRKGNATAAVPGEGIDIALSLDISSSMAQRFATPPGSSHQGPSSASSSRAAKTSHRLVVSRRTPVALAPASKYDASTHGCQCRGGLLPDGTGIGVGLANALNMLQDSTAASRVIILLTDGEHNADSISPEEAAQLAVALKIRVYTIGVVSGDSPFNNREIDEALLRDIAERTNARYFTASSPEALADVYEEIGSLETSRISRESVELFTELAPWFAGSAAALLLLELVLRGTALRRSPA